MIGDLLTTVARITINFGIVGGAAVAGVAGPVGAVVGGVVCAGGVLVLATALAGCIMLTTNDTTKNKGRM